MAVADPNNRSTDAAGTATGAAALGGFLSPAAQQAIEQAGSDDAVRRAGRASVAGPMRALLRRLIPYAAGIEMAILYYEWSRRHRYQEKDAVKAGPPPGSPLYMPPGFTQRDTSAAVDYWATQGYSLQGFVDHKSGGFAGYHWYTDTNIPNDFYQTDNWVTGNIQTYIPGTAPNYAGISWIERFVKAGSEGVPVGTLAAGFDKWEKTADGPGSSTVRFGKVVEWQAPQETWPLSPDALPSIAPMAAPFAVPPGQMLMPIPQRLIWRVGTMTDDLLVDRVSVSPRRLPAPVEDTDPPPRSRPAQPDDTPLEAVIEPGTQTQWQGNTHTYAPPLAGEREVKLRARTPWMFRFAFGTLTEMHDLIGAVHKALPKRCRRSRSWKDKDGKWHRALASSMARDIKNCAGDINLQKAVIHVVANALQDAAIGRTNRMLNSRSGSLFGTTGIQGAGTRMSRGQAGADGHWSNVFTEAGDGLAANASGPTLNEFLSGVGFSANLPTGPRERTRRRNGVQQR